ncbi:KLP6 [Enterospora canceri]|uniref:Kinesin-like protein n=1 Tax=Enterospora canceri TaxID=1081671 RepID=A0A1Y1S5P4_9MICR|nr:KLP6 [Enterospora canceri]
MKQRSQLMKEHRMMNSGLIGRQSGRSRGSFVDERVVSNKTSIDVLVRIRPSQNANPEIAHQGNSISVRNKLFYFNTIYTGETNQEIFSSKIADLVDVFSQGGNATVIAYGQTGSGKTHTMFSNKEDVGLVYQTLASLGSRIHDIEMYEIYNENIYDLLNEYNKCEIGEGGIKGIRRRVVEEKEEMREIVEEGMKYRTTKSTCLNSSSSRSHLILRISNTPNSNKSGVFTFVDLAGSERTSVTNEVGESERRKESIEINKGLLALGNVINTLHSNQSALNQSIYVPYRSSKLTRILKESLVGNVRFITCVRKDVSNTFESSNSLTYAARMSSIKETFTRNRVDMCETEMLKREIEKYKKEVCELREFIRKNMGDRRNIVENNKVEEKTTEISTSENISNNHLRKPIKVEFVTEPTTAEFIQNKHIDPIATKPTPIRITIRDIDQYNGGLVAYTDRCELVRITNGSTITPICKTSLTALLVTDELIYIGNRNMLRSIGTGGMRLIRVFSHKISNIFPNQNNLIIKLSNRVIEYDINHNTESLLYSGSNINQIVVSNETVYFIFDRLIEYRNKRDESIPIYTSTTRIIRVLLLNSTLISISSTIALIQNDRIVRVIESGGIVDGCIDSGRIFTLSKEYVDEYDSDMIKIRRYSILPNKYSRIRVCGTKMYLVGDQTDVVDLIDL